MGTWLWQRRIHQNLDKLISGWAERTWCAFQGRVNGPADNKLSSCLSCHGAAQAPRSLALGIVEAGTGPTVQPGDSDFAIARKVARHVFSYFRNVRSGDLF